MVKKLTVPFLLLLQPHLHMPASKGTRFSATCFIRGNVHDDRGRARIEGNSWEPPQMLSTWPSSMFRQDTAFQIHWWRLYCRRYTMTVTTLAQTEEQGTDLTSASTASRNESRNTFMAVGRVVLVRQVDSSVSATTCRSGHVPISCQTPDTVLF